MKHIGEKQRLSDFKTILAQQAPLEKQVFFEAGGLDVPFVRKQMSKNSRFRSFKTTLYKSQPTD